MYPMCGFQNKQCKRFAELLLVFFKYSNSETLANTYEYDIKQYPLEHYRKHSSTLEVYRFFCQC